MARNRRRRSRARRGARRRDAARGGLRRAGHPRRRASSTARTSGRRCPRTTCRATAPRDDVFVHAGRLVRRARRRARGSAPPRPAIDRAARTVALADGDRARLRPPGARHRVEPAHASTSPAPSSTACTRCAGSATATPCATSWPRARAWSSSAAAGSASRSRPPRGWPGSTSRSSSTPPQPLLRVLGAELGAFFADLHRGARRRRAHAASASRRSRAPAVASPASGCGGELVPADLVAGRRRRGTERRARRGGRPRGGRRGGITVDEHLRTADPAVLAAGDVANAHNTALGHSLRVEHWDNAIRQGAARGAVDPGPGRGLRLAAVLLHRPVRPRHGVRRARRRGRRRRASAATWRDAGVHRVLAARRARPRRDERQRLGRQRAAARARRAGDRARPAGARRTCRSTSSSPRSPPGCCARG